MNRPCPVAAAVAAHYRERTRRDACAEIAHDQRDNLLSDFLDDMANHCDEVLKMLHRMLDEDKEFLDAIMQARKLTRMRDSHLNDTLKAATTEIIGKRVHEWADGTFGGDLEDRRFQELVNA